MVAKHLLTHLPPPEKIRLLSQGTFPAQESVREDEERRGPPATARAQRSLPCCPPSRARPGPRTFPVVVRLEDARDATDPHAAEPHHARITWGRRERSRSRRGRAGRGAGGEKAGGGPYRGSRCWVPPTRRTAAPVGGWTPRGSRR